VEENSHVCFKIFDVFKEGLRISMSNLIQGHSAFREDFEILFFMQVSGNPESSIATLNSLSSYSRHPLSTKVRTNFVDKWRSLGWYSSLADSGHGVYFVYSYFRIEIGRQKAVSASLARIRTNRVSQLLLCHH
jgi:hypothetical protein